MSEISVQKLATISGHRDCIYTLGGSQYPGVFFSGAGDGMVVKWDLSVPNKGVLVAKLPNSIYALDYHRDSGFLVIGHNYDGIHLLDWEKKKEQGSLNITRSAIFDIQSHEDSLFVATGAGEVILIDVKDLRVRRRIKASDKKARTIALNPVHREFAVGYSDAQIRLFDMDSGQLKKSIPAHTNSVFTLAYTADYRLLFSAGRDAHLKVWDVSAGYLGIEDIIAHMYTINHIAFSPDGGHFVTCSMDKSIKVWDARRFKLLKVIDKSRHAGHGTSVNKLLWTRHQGQLLSGSDDRTISVWDIQF